MPLPQIDTENADRNLTSLVTVLTDTPSTTENLWCVGYLKLGDGAKDLDGTGGDFEIVITVAGQTVQPSPQVVEFGTEPRSSTFTVPFPVLANEEVILRIKSPNGSDTDVDVTAYLLEVPVGNTLQIGGSTQSATDLKDFVDTGYDPVEHEVLLVNTTTTNTDMVGTDSANTTTPPTVEEIADQVWDEAISEHVAGASFGAKNQKVVPSETLSEYKATGYSTHDAADAADAVWNEAKAGHTDAGKAGEQLWTDLDAILVDTDELQTDDVPTLITAGNTTVIRAILPIKNGAFSLDFEMVLTAGGVALGKTVTASVSLDDSGTYSAASGSVGEKANGTYRFAGDAEDFDGDSLTLRFSEGDCKDTFIHIHRTAA